MNSERTAVLPAYRGTNVQRLAILRCQFIRLPPMSQLRAASVLNLRWSVPGLMRSVSVRKVTALRSRRRHCPVRGARRGCGRIRAAAAASVRSWVDWEWRTCKRVFVWVLGRQRREDIWLPRAAIRILPADVARRRRGPSALARSGTTT